MGLAPGRADGGVRVEIVASGPINYTSYEPEPGRFIVEIPNVDASALPAEMPIAQAGVEMARVTALPTHGGGAHARIEFTSEPSVRARVEPDGSKLAVVLEPAAGVAPPPIAAPAAAEPVRLELAAAAVAAPPALPAPEPPPAEPATEISGIVVEETGGTATVAIVGNGSLRHKAFALRNPDRLVVDIPGVINRVPEKAFDVAADPLHRVRVAQFRTQPEKVVRVVLDLSRPAPHRLAADEDGLRVIVGEEEPPPVQAAAALPAQEVFVIPAPSEPAAASLPELTPRLIPTGPEDLGKEIVLFDRAEPAPAGEEAPVSVATMPAGMTFQSQTIAGEKRRYRGERISVTFRDADVREVFFFFSDVMKMNIVLDPDVTGKIDIRLTQVPWDQAFQVILKNQGLDAVEEDNVVRIARTQKLRAEAAERRALKQAQEQEVDPITFTRQLSYARVNDAMTIMQQVKTDRGRIVADPRTNTLVISDIPDKRQAYENLLTALDTQTPQVQIEARVVEAIRSFERSLGIDWNFTGLATPALGTQTNLQFPHRAEFQADVNLGSPGAAGTLGLALGNVLDSVTLDVQLDAFEADGKVRILSAPKVVTQNNQQATIEQGVQIPIVTTTATEIEVQYFPASLRLVVTPQITAEQTIIMQVMVENNQPSTTVSVGDTPGIVTERVQTNILVRSGNTAVIGGVYKLQETDNETGIPGLRRIPFFGWLFKNKSFEKNSSELLVFLTPKIVTSV
jgi:type IV pilus assembly protein PilQ